MVAAGSRRELGEVAEWLKAAVSKVVWNHETGRNPQ